jgi:uncharacterized protein YacL
MKSYYVDSCIYLNLWKKEVDEFGRPFWRLAKDFFEKVEAEKSIIYYSGFILKELMFILDTQEYLKRRQMFESSPNFKKNILSREEYNYASKIKNENTDISFYDILHLLLTKKTNSILITNDKKLGKLANTYQIVVRKPEEIL